MAFHFLLFPDSGRNVLEDFIALPFCRLQLLSWLMRVDILAMTKDADARRAWPGLAWSELAHSKYFKSERWSLKDAARIGH